MNSRYSIIALGVLVLALIGGALTWSQANKFAGQKGQVTVNVSQEKDDIAGLNPTLAVPVTGTSVRQIELVVSQPSNGLSVASPGLLVKGKTKPNAEVSINDKETTADANGSFSAVLTLDEGENQIVVTVSDADGNFAEEERTVTYNVQE